MQNTETESVCLQLFGYYKPFLLRLQANSRVIAHRMCIPLFGTVPKQNEMIKEYNSSLSAYGGCPARYFLCCSKISANLAAICQKI